MKWLRSSLFKNNSDTFVFNENVNITIENYDSSLKSVENVVVNGTLTRGGKNKIYVDITITGVFKMISARTLNIISVPFEIIEKEEFIDKTLVDSNALDVNTMDLYIDITPLVNELIILNIPISSYDEDETLELSGGRDWELVSDDEVQKTNNSEQSPFAKLNDIFKDK